MKRMIAATLLLLPVLAFCQAGTFVIEGKIGEEGGPAKVYIYYTSAGQYLLDSARLQKGVFRFTGTIERPCKGLLLLDRSRAGLHHASQRFTCYIEPGRIRVASADSGRQIVLSGTPLNEDAAQLNRMMAPVTVQLAGLQKTDTGYENTRAMLLQQRGQLLQQFIRQHPGSLVSFDALKEYGGVLPDPAKIEPLYKDLSAVLKADEVVKTYYNWLQQLKKTAIGQMAPAFTQPDTAGRPVSLEQFKGRYVLLDFWASWCKPCRKENPAVVRAFNRFNRKGFTIVSVSLDAAGDKQKWLKAIHDDGLTGWTHVSDLEFWSNAAARLYGIQSIPQNFLLDPQGKIIAGNLRGQALENKLQEILGSNQP